MAACLLIGKKRCGPNQNSSKQYPTSPTRSNPVRNGRPHTASEAGQPQPAILDLATYDQLQLGDQEADYLEPAMAQSRIPSLELVDRSRAADRI
jgi:hypothetical protein